MGIIGATVLQTAAINYDMMCVARVVCGVFNGLLTSTVPAYQSECAKPHQRGPLVILSGTLIGFVGSTTTINYSVRTDSRASCAAIGSVSASTTPVETSSGASQSPSRPSSPSSCKLEHFSLSL